MKDVHNGTCFYSLTHIFGVVTTCAELQVPAPRGGGDRSAADANVPTGIILRLSTPLGNGSLAAPRIEPVASFMVTGCSPVELSGYR